MSRPLDFLPEAEAEVAEAVDWYESQQPGLGKEFLSELYAMIPAADRRPELYASARGGTRKIRLSRFHYYCVHFSIEGGVFKVWAVFHGAQNPQRLIRRLRQS
jgi:plasmid stabilization system protein ParE